MFCHMKYKQLTSQQRSQIFALLQRKTSKKEIALIVGCSQSALSREIRRNSTSTGNYLWDKAHAKALERRKRTTTNKRLDRLLVWRIKQMILNNQWSPEQIRGVLSKEGISISIQSIYNIINADESGELRKHCRHPNFKRRPKGERKPTKATNIADRTSIHDRPAEADGKRFGDFEMDLIVDAYGHAILVLLERMTGFVMMERLKHGKKAKPLAKVVVRILFAYRKYIRTITTDNGSEFADFAQTEAWGSKVFFAHPYASWERAQNERHNGLFRSFVPKGVSIELFTDEDILAAADELNGRPRRKLGYCTPEELFEAFLDTIYTA